MSRERDLAQLLAAMQPQRRPGEFVFVLAAAEEFADLRPQAMVREAEGVTFVLERDQADAHGLSYDFIAAWVTLTVHSALDAVGLTAAVAARLADAGISCNVIAGLFHDHLLVPVHRADDALEVLCRSTSL